MTAKRIGYTSPYLPPEIIFASGLTPVRLRPAESLSAADGFLPRNFSVEARALLAAALENGLDLDAVVFLDEDDTSRRLFDVWQAYAETPALGLVPLPRLDSEPACQRYAHALIALSDSLAALSGQPLTADGLRRAIDLYNEQRCLWRSLRQRWIEGALSASEWHDLRWMALTADPESANAELAARLLPHPQPLSQRERGEKTRLLLLGGMNIPRQLLAFIESCGARVIAEDSEADERVVTEPVSGPDMDALAAAYLTKPCGPRPNALARRLERITQLLDERGAQGVVAYYPKFADAYLAEYLVLAEVFKARGLPALLLEDDGESGFSGQQRTRLEAFLEVLS
ncbi:MAG: 2-hydroxyacyl-CoA dehydratase [Chloroflexi bacterium]|nr:2-hydroxyacyl-CoA dehydratase [Chloroflexota bacterium]